MRPILASSFLFPLAVVLVCLQVEAEGPQYLEVVVEQMNLRGEVVEGKEVVQWDQGEELEELHLSRSYECHPL